MFLNLPQELREQVYDALDIMSRTKLNMALPKDEKISSRDRDKFLRFMAMLIKHKGYESSDQLYGEWKEYIIDHPTDPTILELIQVHPNQLFIHIVKRDLVSEIEPYTLDFNTSIFYYDHILCELAKYASKKGFSALEKNPSTSYIIESIFKEENTQRLFWYDLIEQQNYELLLFLSSRFSFNIHEMIDTMVTAYPSLCRVKTLCEFYQIDKSKKETIFYRALDECQFEIVEYLDPLISK